MPRDVVGHISPVLTVPPHSKEPIIENTLVAFPKLKSMKKGYTRERTNNNNNPKTIQTTTRKVYKTKVHYI